MRDSKRLICGFVLFMFPMALVGCTTNPVPPGYSGPLSRIADSYVSRSDNSIDFFYLAKINGKRVDNSLSQTTQANYGQGFSLRPVAVIRDIPSEPAKFTIYGRTHYAAPILELINKVYEISGDAIFTPVAGRTYTVKGKLGDEGSSVWIEDETGATMDNKIEIKGPATLNLLQK